MATRVSALTHQRDFSALRVLPSKRCCALRITAAPPQQKGPSDGGLRLGIATPRHIGSAVARNRVRRRVREAIRVQLDQLPDADVFVVASRPRQTDRGTDIECTFDELCRCLLSAVTGLVG